MILSIGLGTGDILENTENRMKYVQSLSREDINKYIESLFYSLDNNEDINKYIESLFYEKVEKKSIDKIKKKHNLLDEEQKKCLKSEIKEKCIQRPENGYAWNMYMPYMTI